jgi:LuxR family transcriptional regulator, maltose regulon positive regulatory protein
MDSLPTDRWSHYNLAMADLILATKLWSPTVQANLVPRSRLIHQINDNLGLKLTLLSAPAGFGKTTLLAEWLAQTDNGCAWLSLDAYDNDLPRFLRYLAAALQTVDEGLGETAVSLLEPPEPSDSQYVITSLINDIARQNGRIVLILDDYHHIENPAIHHALAYLLEHQPPQLHLIISSRADPLLPLGRLRVRQQMDEIRAADLRFTSDEAAIFLRHLWGIQLSPEQVAALEARTEGWVAGLHLAVLALRQLTTPEEIANFVAAFTGSHRYILDYLVDEALHWQPPAVQNFLLQSAILDRFCADLCQAVLEIDNAQALLAQVKAANLFLVPLDDRGEWFRYHRLFADLLRHRLKQSQPIQLAPLHQRASRWFEQHGLTDEAIHHALAANDAARAAALVDEARWTLRNRGEVSTLRRWLDMLPKELVEANGSLAVGRAWTLMYSGRMAETEAYLARVVFPLLPQAPPDSDWPVELSILRAQIALNHGQFDEALNYCLEARAKIHDAQFRFRGSLELMLGHAYRAQGNLAAAGQAYATAAGIAAQDNNRYTSLSALISQANLAMLSGRLRQAETFWQQGLGLTYGRRGQRLPLHGMPKVGLGRIYLEWNRLDEAAACLEEAIQLGQQAGIGPVVLNGAIALAQTRQAQGDFAGARAVLRLAEETMQRTQMALLDLRLGAAIALLRLRQGKLSRAAAWAARFTANFGLERAADSGDWFVFEYAILARIWLAEGRPVEAAALLGQLLASAEKMGRWGQAVEIWALQALALQAQDEVEAAAAALICALRLAEPEGYTRLFADEGRPMGELLARTALQETAVAPYVTRLLSAFDAPQLAAPPSLAVATETETAVAPHLAQWLAEPLSERETEVLRLVAEGLSNREIGERLVISIYTVKKHMENIHGKLYVSNRTQAVARARELGLL